MLRPGISWECAPLLRVLRVLRDGQGRGAILARVRAGPVTGFGRGTVRRAALAGGRGAVPLGQRPLLWAGRPGRGRDGRHRGGHLVPGRSRGRHRGGTSHGPPLASRGKGRGSGRGRGRRDLGRTPGPGGLAPGLVPAAAVPVVGLAAAGLGGPVLAGGRIAQAGALVLLYQVQPDDHSQHNDRYNGWQADHERSHRTIQQA